MVLLSPGVVDIAYGSGPHVVAMTTAGELHSWGHDSYGQLGLGVLINTSQGTIPRRIRGELEGVRVAHVACGGHHTLALTAEGQVSGKKKKRGKGIGYNALKYGPLPFF